MSKKAIKARAALAVAGALLVGSAHADIQHLVVFRYKAGVPAATKADIARRFVQLKDQARRNGRPYIVAIRGGQAISKEGLDRGFEQAFVVTFKNESDRDFFVGKPYVESRDPAHDSLAKVVEPLIETDAHGKPTGLLVFDFDDTVAGR